MTLRYTFHTGIAARVRTGCLIAGVFERGALPESTALLDRAARGALSKLIKRGDLHGKSGETLLVPGVSGISAERVLLVGLGPQRDLDLGRYREAITSAIRVTKGTPAHDALNLLPLMEVKDLDPGARIRHAVEVTESAMYRFDRLKTGKKKSVALRAMTFPATDRKSVPTLDVAARQALAIAEGANLARELGNLPGNLCTPSHLADEARALGRQHGLKVQVLETKDMQALKMGSLLSVSRGSRQPPKLIVVEYKGGAGKPVVLVGKGLTFDAGGISIKPAAAMDEMKYDMCGGASVLGAIKAAALMKLPLHVIGVVPSSENLPDGDANKPGDVVTSMSGQTIEILNTDAEGRLILCDALTYAERFDPAAVVDIATLTGACVIALGNHASGLFANDDALADELLAAGRSAHDRAWRLPLWDDYQKQLDTHFADMANVGGREGGAITAACFLARYTKKFKWAHLDIAGTAWRSGKDKGGTGRPVPLLVHFLMKRAGV